MVDVKTLESDRLSTFRTRHRFLHFGEFETVEEFVEYRRWASERGLELFILANGSNTLFVRKKVRTLVVRNRLKPWMNDLGDGRIEASSSLPVMRILKFCEKHGFDSFYFLASVPATVGGAVAMNAGGGTGPTVLDYAESVTFLDGETVKAISAQSLARSHRMTQFTGIHDSLIVSVVFRFPRRELKESEVHKRIQWCHDHQDLSAPNIGSVFRKYHGPILRKFRRIPPGGIAYPLFRTQFSRKVNNWIISRSSSSWPIVFLIRVVQFVHRLFGRKAETELIEVR